MVVLGIETSCDETALGLVADGRLILGTEVASSLKIHQKYGGVVPEMASRAHVEWLTLELETLLGTTGVAPSQVDLIAVTAGPGLAGSLVVGIAAAKALAIAWEKPVVGVNHLHAHLYAAFMGAPDFPLDLPLVGLVISGGHTALVRTEGIHRYHLLGQTRDDAVGEAFDKVAKLLGLSFPGGPEIERAAYNGNPKAFRFSVPKMKSGSLFDFSLSGIKTAVLYKIQDELKKQTTNRASPVTDRHSLDAGFTADMCASFQNAVVEEVVQKTVLACRISRVKHLVVGGGVIANSHLRERLLEACRDSGFQCAIPAMNLCTDNGAMVAGLGYHMSPAPLSTIVGRPDLPVELN